MNQGPQKVVAFVAPYFPPDGGGSERYAYEIAFRLRKNHGWRVIFIASGERLGADTKEEIDGITVYRLGYLFKLSNTPLSLVWPVKIKKIFEAEHPDIVNVNMPVPGIGDIAARFLHNEPLVVTYHAGSMKKGIWFIDAIIATYERAILPFLLSRADRIVSSSNSVRINFLARYREKSITITPGVDSSRFKPPEKSVHDPIVLFVAGLNHGERYKGLDDLLEAIHLVRASIPNVTLTVIGDGDIRRHYEARAKELGIRKNVIFAGKLTGDKLVAAYQEGYVLVMASSNESFGMVLLEAMASRLPVIGTTVGDVPMIINDKKTGLLFTPHDTKALAEKLMMLLGNPKRAAAFGRAGYRKAITDFNWDHRAEHYDRLFGELIAKKIHDK
jgi:glycosyltransferase involved in cell wall biosynthesis